MSIPRDAPAVFYGGRTVPGAGDKTHGGIVKLRYIQSEFPDSPRRFNIICLVSSALPPDWPALLLLARLRRIPIILNQNGVAYPAWCPDGWREENIPHKLFLRHAEFVFFQSMFCWRTASRFAFSREVKAEVLYNPVDCEHFRPGHARSERAPLLLLGGSQMEWYRVDLALKTLAELRCRGFKAKLLVTGKLGWCAESDVARNQFAERISELGLHGEVDYYGPYSQEEAPRLYQRADILLHTQVYDASPGLVGEAMACGLPIAYIASGGLPEIVGSDAGVGVQTPEDYWKRHIPSPCLMAEAVIKIMTAYERYASAARKNALEKMDARDWKQAYRRVIDRTFSSAFLK